jgi:hypothetical protein
VVAALLEGAWCHPGVRGLARQRSGGALPGIIGSVASGLSAGGKGQDTGVSMRIPGYLFSTTTYSYARRPSRRGESA